MRLEDVLREDCVLPDLEATEKRELLDEMVTDLSTKIEGLSREDLLEAILEREQLGSTGIGYGVAIPHAKISGFDRIIVSFARSKVGVAFQSTDEKPVNLFFLIVAPENSTAAHLKVLASISRILKDGAFRKNLLKAGSRKDLYNIIIDADSRQ